MRGPLLLAALLLASSAATALPLHAQDPTLDPVVDSAVDHLVGEVGDTGCVDGSAGVCSSRSTDWTIMAVAAAGVDPDSWPKGQTSPVEYLREHPNAGGDMTTESLWRARRILAVVSAGEDPSSFGGVDHVTELRKTFNGQFGRAEWVNDDMFAILALTAAGVPPDDAMIQQASEYVVQSQADDGRWCSASRPGSGGCPSPTDMTAAGIEALLAAGRSRDEANVREAVDYLEAQQLSGADSAGCLRAKPGEPVNPDSTAWATLALLRLHADLRQAPWVVAGASPVDCLLDFHDSQTGGFTNQKGRVDTYTTTQALRALTGTPHGLTTWPPRHPSASVFTDGTARVNETVVLEVPTAASAAIWIENRSIENGTKRAFVPQTAGDHQIETIAFDDAGRTNVSRQVLTVEPAEPDDASSDDDGGSSSDSPGTSKAPTVSIQHAPARVHRNESFEIDLAADPADARVVSFRVDWDDATPAEWASPSLRSHTYETLGARTLTVWAKDADGDVSTPVHHQVEVDNAPPEIEIEGPASVHRMDEATLRANVTDPDGPTHQAHVAWQLPDGDAHGRQVTLAPTTPGTHLVNATVQDADGANTTGHHELTVWNRAPVVHGIEPLLLASNQTHTLEVNVSDPEHDPLTVTWRLDGNVSWGHQRILHAGPPANRTLHVNVSDPWGNTTSIERTLRIREAPDQAEPRRPNGTGDNGTDADPQQAQHDDPGQANATSKAPTPPGATDDGPPNGANSTQALAPATVTLPNVVEVLPETPATVNGTATQPGGQVQRVQAELGGPLPVNGSSSFSLELPPLPEGTYELAVRAEGTAGDWGPWTRATVVVEEEVLRSHKIPERPASSEARADDAERTVPTTLVPPLAAVGLALLVRRRRA